jgi:hypothetical protein
MNETLIQPPKIGPQLPIYPALPQIVRITGAALSGTNVYPALTDQYSGALAFRDREPCWFFEPNGTACGVGYYNARLIGSFPVVGDPHFGSVTPAPLYAGRNASGAAGTTINVSDGVTVFPGINTVQFPVGTVTAGGGTAIYTPAADEHDINRWKHSAQWHTANNSGGIVAGYSLNAGYWQAIPVILTGNRRVTDLGFWLVGAGGAGNLAEMALYNVASDAAVLPNAVVAGASVTNFDISALSDQMVTLTPAGATITPGLYWLFISSKFSIGVLAVSGIVPPLMCVPSGGSIVQVQWLKTATGGNPFPSGFPNNPFSLATDYVGSNNPNGPFLAWKFT